MGSKRVSYHSPLPRMWFPAEVGIEDPSSATCQLTPRMDLEEMPPTAANSAEKLKKLASNRATSSVRKWPPRTFVCTQYISSHSLRVLYNPRPNTYGTRLCRISMIDSIQIESGRRDFTPCTSAICNQLPQLLRIADISRKSTAHANNGNRHVRIHIVF